MKNVQLQLLPLSAEDARRRTNSDPAQVVNKGYRAVEPELVPLEGQIGQFVIQ